MTAPTRRAASGSSAIAIAWLGVATGCSAQPPPHAPSPANAPKGPGHLVLHYTFDDCTARDVSGNRHDGVVHGAPRCVDGPVGKALSFDGAHDYVTVRPLRHDPLAPELTVAGWVDAVGFGGRWVTILTIGNTSMETPFAVIYAVDDQKRLLPHTRLTSVTGQLDLHLLAYPAGVEASWFFFAWTYNRGTIKIYRDGALAATYDSGLSQLASTSQPIDIGRDVPGATEYLQGALDDVRLYDYELSPEEIRKLWQLGDVRAARP